MPARRSVSLDLPVDSPWRAVEHRVVAAVLAVAFGLIGLAWFGAGGTVDWTDQLRWTALAIGGVTLVGFAGALWLGLGLRRVRLEKRALCVSLVARRDRLAAYAAPVAERGANRVTRVGMSHHHAPDCLLVAGKDVRELTADDLDLVPCGVCGASERGALSSNIIAGAER